MELALRLITCMVHFLGNKEIVLASNTRIVLEILLVQAWYFFGNSETVLAFKKIVLITNYLCTSMVLK